VFTVGHRLKKRPEPEAVKSMLGFGLRRLADGLACSSIGFFSRLGDKGRPRRHPPRAHDIAGRIPPAARSVTYEIRLSYRAERVLDRLDKPTQKRMVRRLEELAEGPYNPRLSASLSGPERLRKSPRGRVANYLSGAGRCQNRVFGDDRAARAGLQTDLTARFFHFIQRSEQRRGGRTNSRRCYPLVTTLLRREEYPPSTWAMS
jgi:hypothetical protein